MNQPALDPADSFEDEFYDLVYGECKKDFGREYIEAAMRMAS